MDKITRILFLFSKLSRGERVNKITFCMEADCLPRTFDRDIEDIRLYLSEMFYSDELIYDRRENNYYLLKGQRQPLEKMEYLFIERLLLDTGVLRKDELDGLLSRLAQNTDNSTSIIAHKNELLKSYVEAVGKVPILKMSGDLQNVIGAGRVIEINYKKADGDAMKKTLIPCMLKYESGCLYLIAYRYGENERYPRYYRVDRIISFVIKGEQKSQERAKVYEYIGKSSSEGTMPYGGKVAEIVLECDKEYYPYVCDRFRAAELREEKTGSVVLKIKTFEDGFIKWFLGQPMDSLKVLKPDSIKSKIYSEAKKIF